jgi:hypothetical protein
MSRPNPPIAREKDQKGTQKKNTHASTEPLSRLAH